MQTESIEQKPKPKRIRVYTPEQKERDRVNRQLKYISNCDSVKRASKAWRDANKDHVKKQRYKNYWAEAELRRARARQDYRENSDRYKDNARKWMDANPIAANAIRRNYKARKGKAEGTHAAEDITRIMVSQKSRCAYCRVSIKKSYHVDHITPLSAGGSNWPKNIQLTCAPCNIRKRDADPIEFAQRIGRLL